MTMLYVILPLALLFACGAVAAFAWTVRSGQMDDVETPPRRLLFDDEPAESAFRPEGFADPAHEPMNPTVLDWHDS